MAGFRCGHFKAPLREAIKSYVPCLAWGLDVPWARICFRRASGVTFAEPAPSGEAARLSDEPAGSAGIGTAEMARLFPGWSFCLRFMRSKNRIPPKKSTARQTNTIVPSDILHPPLSLLIKTEIGPKCFAESATNYTNYIPCFQCISCNSWLVCAAEFIIRSGSGVVSDITYPARAADMLSDPGAAVVIDVTRAAYVSGKFILCPDCGIPRTADRNVG